MDNSDTKLSDQDVDQGAHRTRTADLDPEPDDGPARAQNQSLISADRSRGYDQRWVEIQSRFVDEPRDSVREADKLVGEVLAAVTETFSNERKQLEGKWSGGSEVSTEDLRRALQRYREFFRRLLAV